MTLLTKNPHPPSKKFFLECRLEDLPHLLTLRPVNRTVVEIRNPNSSGDIPAQSHVRLGIFFPKSPKVAGCQAVNQVQMHQNFEIPNLNRKQHAIMPLVTWPKIISIITWIVFSHRLKFFSNEHEKIKVLWSECVKIKANIDFYGEF